MMLGEHTYYDAQLIADAPLLLAEVKRLREQLQLAYEWVGLYEDTHMMDTFTMFLGDDEE